MRSENTTDDENQELKHRKNNSKARAHRMFFRAGAGVGKYLLNGMNTLDMIEELLQSILLGLRA